MAIQITQVSTEFSTTAQIQPTDMQEIANLGFKTIINNRPDFEGGANQPTSEQIKVAAEKLGLAYIFIPVVPNNIQPEQVSAFKITFAQAKKPVLGFCRTGNRAQNSQHAPAPPTRYTDPARPDSGIRPRKSHQCC